MMKVYSRIYIYLSISIILLNSSCSRHKSFEELKKNISIEFNLRTYSSTTLKYSISVPKRFGLPEKYFKDTVGIETFLDKSKVFGEGTSILSVAKFHFKDKKMTLKKAWDMLRSKRVMMEGFKIYSDGLTDFLSIPAYYEHAAVTMSKKDVESISFLVSGESSSFICISLYGISDEAYPDNIKELLYCAKTIKILAN